MTGPYALGAPTYRTTGLGQPVPIRGKVMFIPGVSGVPGRITPAQLDNWATEHAHQNLGLVLDHTVVAIDVDDAYLNRYGRAKHGAASVAMLEQKLGVLPATITSTSRHDTHRNSRVHLYRITEADGRRLTTNVDLPPQRPGDLGSDVEVLHHNYRYVAAWPSVHPDTGNTYRWYDREEQPLDGPPDVSELEDLPEAWVGYLLNLNGEPGRRDNYGYASREEVDAVLTDGDPHPDLAAIALRFWQEDVGHGNGKDLYGPDLLGLTRTLAEATATRALPGSRAALKVARQGYLRPPWDTPHNRRAFEAAFNRSLKFWVEKTAERQAAADLERELHEMFGADPNRVDLSTGEVADKPPRPASPPTPGPPSAEPAPSATYDASTSPDASRADGAALAALERYEQEILAEMGRTRVREEARRRLDEEVADTVTLPRLVRLDQFLDEPDEDTEWRVEGLLPTGGNILLAAAQKSGKSTAVANLARALADGTPFLGAYETQPARIVILDDESDERQWRRRLHQQNIQHPENVHLVALRGRLATFNILDPAVRSRWADLIRGADVLIFDCIRPALDALGLSEDKEAGRFLVALDALKLEAGVGEMIGVHHMGHDGQRSRGDSRLLDWPDANWKIYLQRDDEGGGLDHHQPREFDAFGRMVDVARTILEFDEDSQQLTIGQGRVADVDATGLRLDVLAAIQGHPGISKNAVTKAIMGPGRTRAAVHKALDQLVRDGRIFTEPGDNNSINYRPWGFSG